jgi:hypothetical protein
MHAYIHASIHPSIHPYIHTYIHTYRESGIVGDLSTDQIDMAKNHSKRKANSSVEEASTKKPKTV